MAKPILKLFQPSGIYPHHSSFLTQCMHTQFQGKPLSWGVKCRGGKNWRFLTCWYFILHLIGWYGCERVADTLVSLHTTMCHYFRIIPEKPQYTTSREYFN